MTNLRLTLFHNSFTDLFIQFPEPPNSSTINIFLVSDNHSY